MSSKSAKYILIYLLIIKIVSKMIIQCLLQLWYRLAVVVSGCNTIRVYQIISLQVLISTIL